MKKVAWLIVMVCSLGAAPATRPVSRIESLEQQVKELRAEVRQLQDALRKLESQAAAAHGPAKPSAVDPVIEEAIQKNKVIVGMTEDQVNDVLRAAHIEMNRYPDERLERGERATYSILRPGEGLYRGYNEIVIRNGKVVSVEH